MHRRSGPHARGPCPRPRAPSRTRRALRGLNRGRVDVERLRRALVGVPLRRAADGRLVLAVDVSPWLRPDADTSSDRSVLDAGYDAPRIAHLLADMPIEVLGRLRSDRVMRKPVPIPWICPPCGRPGRRWPGRSRTVGRAAAW
ncbi:transposase [Streptomyces erythrochromogenes]|uniref:transposase n=1 Tax=Streptomyces erythrochromogenes TaxID=285574 RepID=UPI0037F147FF